MIKTGDQIDFISHITHQIHNAPINTQTNTIRHQHSSFTIWIIITYLRKSKKK